MEHNNEGVGTFCTLTSIIFGFISQSTLSELAAIMAILAGATGMVFNCVKLYYYVKSKRNK